MDKFFKSLDAEGWAKFRRGAAVLVATGVLAYILAQTIHLFIGALVAFTGFDISFRMFDHAMLGSLFRERNGKNKNLYLARKAYLDERFLAVYGVNTRIDEHKDSFAEVLAATFKTHKAVESDTAAVVYRKGFKFRVTRSDVERIKFKFQ